MENSTEDLNNRFSLAKRLRSFSHAFAGIKILLQTQHNARIHAVATLVVILAGMYFPITSMEWIVLIFCLALVWSAEAMNSALEFLSDAVTTKYHPLIKKAKDLAAAAVLITAIASVVVAFIVFGKYVLEARV